MSGRAGDRLMRAAAGQSPNRLLPCHPIGGQRDEDHFCFSRKAEAEARPVDPRTGQSYGSATNTISGHKPPSGKHANILSGSVNAADLANGAGTLNKLAPNSVNSGKVVNGSLKAADTDGSSIQHRLGGCAAGNAIESVAQNGASTCTAVGFTQVTLRSGHAMSGGAKVLCQPGETVVGGGFDGSGEAFTSEPAAASISGQQGWVVDTNPAGPVTVYALCAK